MGQEIVAPTHPESALADALVNALAMAGLSEQIIPHVRGCARKAASILAASAVLPMVVETRRALSGEEVKNDG
ncbi:MAG TPA: hypothetical protein VHI13_16790 [Candidatus Kapabacteria bacterium]|nr:hypothetical protein [Candidatus Kapabacteria bacterium]